MCYNAGEAILYQLYAVILDSFEVRVPRAASNMEQDSICNSNAVLTAYRINMTTEQKQITLTDAYTDFNKALNTYASFKVSSNALSEDLVQDAFIKTWSYLAKGGEIVKMKAFLYHVLNGLIIDEYRKHKATSLDVMIENGFEPNDKSFERGADVFDGKIAVLLISKLPRAYQQVMRMRYVQDLSLAEIAALTGKTKNAITVHSHRGLEKLRQLYNHVPA